MLFGSSRYSMMSVSVNIMKWSRIENIKKNNRGVDWGWALGSSVINREQEDRRPEVAGKTKWVTQVTSVAAELWS